MSTKVKNAETKLVTDSQVTPAAQVADAAKPSASTKVSAQAPQAAAALAVKKPSEAEVAKKKALEEEALAEDQIAAEESQTAADAQAATQPLVEALESQVELVTVDQESAEEIARVAEELDGGVTGLEAAARDIGMMFAQAGSSATTVSTIGGVSTGAVVAGVVVVGAVAAASGGSSSSGAAASSSSGGGAATAGSYDMLSVGLAPTTFLASPSGTLAAVTATTVSGTASYNSAFYTNQFLTKSTAAAAWTFAVSDDLVGSISTQGTTSNDLFALSASDLSGLLSDPELATATAGYEVSINGGAGTDLLALTLDGAVAAELSLVGVELVSVTTSGVGARTLDVSGFSGVSEIVNSGSTQSLTVTGLSSAATYIGLGSTAAVTTLTYSESLGGTNSTVNLVLDETANGTGVIFNTQGIEVGGISTVRISSNGDVANELSSLVQSASGTRGIPELITTIQAYGDNDLTISDISGMTGVTLVDASGMKGDFTLDMGALSGVAYSVVGGAGADEVDATVSGATALNTNRIETADLTLGGSTNSTVNLSNTVGLSTVKLAGSLAGSATLGFTNIESGTAFTTSATTSVAGASTFTFKSLGDFAFTAAHNATFTGGLVLNKARIGTLTTSAAAVAADYGAVTLGADVQELNVRTSNTGTATLASVTGGASTPLIVKYATSNTGAITQSGTTTATKDLYVSASATKGNVDIEDVQSLQGKVVLDMDAVSANASIGDIVAQTDISVTIDSGVSYSSNPNNAPTQFTSVIQGSLQANTGDISLTLNAAAPEASGVVSITGGMAADGRVSLVANNGQYGDIFVNGTIQAVEDIHINVRGLEYTQLSIGNMSALDDVGVAVSAGVGSTGTIGNVVSSRGDVAVALNIDSLANDATSADPEVSTYSIGTINTSAGSVTLGTVSVGTSVAGNTGAVQTMLGEEATLSVGNITAVAGDIDIGGVNGLELGVRSDLRLGSLTANSAGKTISVGSAEHVLAVALEGTVTMGNISAGGDVLINADLDRGATIGGGATVDAVGGTTTISVVGGESNAFMNFANVSAAGALSIDFVGGNNSTAALGALTSDNAGIDLDLTADTFSNASAISARSNIDISIKTISDGSGTLGTGGITSLSGNITVKGDTVLAASTAISTVTFGALTATSANGAIAIGSVQDAIALDSLTDLSLGNINATREVGIYAELAANATLGGQNTVDSVASTTTISGLGGAAGSYLDFANVSASGALTIDFVGGNNSTARFANLTSDNAGISLDLTADTFTNTGATNTAAGDIDISIVTISNGTGTFGSFTSTAGNIEIQGDTALADSTSASTITVGAINVNAAGKTFMVGSVSDSISIGDNAGLALGAISARGDVALYASMSQAATLGSGNSIDSISGTTTINATSAEPSSVLHFGNVSASGALAIDFVGGNSSDVLLGNILSDTGSVRVDVVAGDTITMGSVIAAASTASVDLDLTTLNGTPTVLVNDSISAGRDVDLKLTLAANDTATDIATAGGITATYGDVRVSGLSSIATGNQVDIGFVSATSNGGSVSFGSAASEGEVAINGIMNVDSIDAYGSVDIYVELGGGATTALAGQFNQVNNAEVVVSNGTATFDVVAGNNSQFALGNVTAQGAITSDFVGTTGSAQSFGGNLHATDGNIDIDFTGGEFDVVGNISAEGIDRTIVLDLTLTDSANSSNVSSGANDKIHAGGDITVTIMASASVTVELGDSANANAGLISDAGSVRVTGDSFVGTSGVLDIGRIYADGQLGTVSIGDSTVGGAIELNASSTMSVGEISSEGDVGVYVNMAAGATLDIANITVDGGVDSGDVYISALGSTAFTDLRLDTIRGEDRVDVIFRGDEMSTVDIGDVETVDNNVVIDLVVGNQTTAGAGGAAAVTIDNIDAANRNDGISTAFGDATVTVVAGTRANISIGDRGTSNAGAAEVNASGNVNITLTTGEGTVNTVRDITSVSGDVNLINTVRSSSDQLVAANTTLTYGDVTANDQDINIDVIVGGDGGFYIADLLAGDDITIGGLDLGQNTLAATIGFDADVTTATIRAVDDINIRANLDSGASWSSGTIQSVDGDVYINFQTTDNGQLTTATGTGAITLGAINADRGAATVMVQTSESVIDSPTITMPSINANTITLNYRGTDDATLSVPSATNGTGDLTTVLTSTAQINNGKVIDVDLAGTADIKLALNTAATNGNNTETDANLLRGTLSILGSESTDTIIGGEGVDTILGNGGNDLIIVWDLQDISGLAESINGGAGTDTLRFRVASSVFDLDPTGTNTINTIDFTTVTNTQVERIELAHNSVLRIDLANMTNVTQIDGDYVATGGSDIELDETGTYDFGQSVFTVFEDIHTIYATTSAGAVTVNGSYNHDHIIGGTSADSLVGGSGNDTLVGGNGNDTIVGGSGDDSISGGIGDDSISADEGSNYVDGGLGNNTVSAGSGADTIVTSSGNDTIVAGNGANSVSAGAGTNSITAGTGADTIIGGNDGDTVVASDGANSVDVGNGTNSVTAGTGNDTIIGGTGGDTVAASEGTNYVTVGDGTNSVTAGSGSDTIIGGSNDDIIAAGHGNNSINAGNGANSITAGSGNDLVITTAGADTIVLSGGTDTVDAGEGANSITTGTGTDSIVTGDAADTISASDGANTIRAGDGANHITAGTGSDYIVVTNGADTVVASHGTNTVLAGDGANSITAGSGSDSIIAGIGNDTIAASDGTNVVDAGAGANSITAGTGADSIITLDGQDTIVASEGNNTVTSTGGNDSITAGSGNDSISVGDGADTVVAGNGNNTVDGGSGVDSITTGDGSDSILAGEGADIIVSGSGADTIDGGAGNDSITAGAGSDRLTGGGGSDTFVILQADSNTTGGIDLITDFAGGSDILKLGSAASGTINTGSGGADLSIDSVAVASAGTSLVNLLTNLQTAADALAADEFDQAGDTFVVQITGASFGGTDVYYVVQNAGADTTVSAADTIIGLIGSSTNALTVATVIA